MADGMARSQWEYGDPPKKPNQPSDLEMALTCIESLASHFHAYIVMEELKTEDMVRTSIELCKAALDLAADIRKRVADNQEWKDSRLQGALALRRLIKTVAPQVDPLPSTAGMVTQLENYIAGLQALLNEKH